MRGQQDLQEKRSLACRIALGSHPSQHLINLLPGFGRGFLQGSQDIDGARVGKRAFERNAVKVIDHLTHECLDIGERVNGGSHANGVWGGE